MHPSAPYRCPTVCVTVSHGGRRSCMTVPANARLKGAQQYLLTLGLKYVCQRSLLTSPVCAH
jgi:hypothetical protein